MEWQRIYLGGSNYSDRLNSSNNLTNNIANITSVVLVPQGIAHNVEITFLDNVTYLPLKQIMIYNGDPSNNAIIVSRKISIHDGEINRTKYAGSPIEDIDPSTKLYNIVDVKLILWRM